MTEKIRQREEDILAIQALWKEESEEFKARVVVLKRRIGDLEAQKILLTTSPEEQARAGKDPFEEELYRRAYASYRLMQHIHEKEMPSSILRGEHA